MDAEEPGEYRRIAAKMDSWFLGHVSWQGPYKRRLTEYSRILPLCIGGFSEEVQNLIDILTIAMPKKVGMTRGRPGSDQGLAIITSH